MSWGISFISLKLMYVLHWVKLWTPKMERELNARAQTPFAHWLGFTQSLLFLPSHSSLTSRLIPDSCLPCARSNNGLSVLQPLIIFVLLVEIILAGLWLERQMYSMCAYTSTWFAFVSLRAARLCVPYEHRSLRIFIAVWLMHTRRAHSFFLFVLHFSLFRSISSTVHNPMSSALAFSIWFRSAWFKATIRIG